MKKTFIILLIGMFINAFTLPCFSVTVNTDTKIPIVPDYTLCKDLHAGDIIQGHVKSDIYAGQKVVIKQNAPVQMYVNEAQNAHRWGRGGRLILSNGTVEDISGRERDIQFYYEVKGEDKDGIAAIAGICLYTIILSPIALIAFKKGKEAVLLPHNIIYAELVNPFSL